MGPGWRAAPSLLVDSPVPKPNIETEAGTAKGKGAVKRDALVKNALENAAKTSQQVREISTHNSDHLGNSCG